MIYQCLAVQLTRGKKVRCVPRNYDVHAEAYTHYSFYCLSTRMYTVSVSADVLKVLGAQLTPSLNTVFFSFNHIFDLIYYINKSSFSHSASPTFSFIDFPYVLE